MIQPADRTCDHCDRLFVPVDHRHKYCTEECRLAEKIDGRPLAGDPPYALTWSVTGKIAGMTEDHVSNVGRKALKRAQFKLEPPVATRGGKRRGKKHLRLVNSSPIDPTAGSLHKQDNLDDLVARMDRPKTYGDCAEIGVCPFISCRAHLLLNSAGVKRNRQGKLVSFIEFNAAATDLLPPGRTIESLNDDETLALLEAMPETCSLRVANNAHRITSDGREVSGLGHAEIAKHLGFTRQRIEQYERMASNRVTHKRGHLT